MSKMRPSREIKGFISQITHIKTFALTPLAAPNSRSPGAVSCSQALIRTSSTMCAANIRAHILASPPQLRRGSHRAAALRLIYAVQLNVHTSTRARLKHCSQLGNRNTTSGCSYIPLLQHELNSHPAVLPHDARQSAVEYWYKTITPTHLR
jgi:hypothetical protein